MSLLLAEENEMDSVAVANSPIHLIGSGSSDGELETRSPVSVSAGAGDCERPERMRDWLIRLIATSFC